ncbi:peroxidase-related enzyme [Microvirgula aerodenitrificans]|uniref:peroxidase-related enzyme n=1 Tax=Microvirgula aerodenitrificans TaxID=57480 RepID=UPI00190113E2|nr:peroxidase-related enzyme [Microvirgula aerodenitrificans]
MTDTLLTHPDNRPPLAFTREQLEWLPWLEPLPEAELTDRHRAGLVDAARARSAYFRLLARDPDTLGARTRTDKDIFYNPDAGLPRAERELSAAATSRYNGCLYCASVHARFAAHFSHRDDDVQRLLDDGVRADLGNAGTPSSPHRSRCRPPRRPSVRRRPHGCARPGWTTWPLPTSSMVPHSSTGPTG